MRTVRGFSLLEVMVAAAVLGMAATALFALFSRSLSNLAKIEDVHRRELISEEVMTRVLMLPALPPDGRIEGDVDQFGAHWTVNVRPWIPANLDEKPASAVMKVDVEVSWRGRTSVQTRRLETLRSSALNYGAYDFKQAVEQIIPE